jgi:thiol-disulfide isomerase/thioredoxin
MSGVGKKALKIDGIEYVQGKDAGEIEAGKCYVIEFWATWCPPCRTSIPHINSLQEKYKVLVDSEQTLTTNLNHHC